jgi:hypothetical protein
MFQGISVKDWVLMASGVFALFAVPFTLLGIWRNRVMAQEAENWKTRQEEIGTYNDINTRYAEFLKTLLSNSDVDIGEFQTPRKLTSETEIYKRNLMYAMLVSLMERAHLLYTEIEQFEKSGDSRKGGSLVANALESVEMRFFGKHPNRYKTHIVTTQRPGWEAYFEHYCSHEAFRQYWLTPGPEGTLPGQWHDTDFERFVNGLIDKAAQHSTPR